MFSLLTVAGLLVTTLVAFMAAGRPTASVDARYGPVGSVVLEGIDIADPAAMASFTDGTGAVVLELPVRELVTAQEPRGTPEENAAFFARRDRLAGLLARDGVVLHSPDGRMLGAFAIPSGGFRLTPDSWVAIGVGFLSLMGGLWVLVLRPREPAAQLFAVSGASLWVASLTIILNVQSDLATPGWMLWAQLQTNHICGLVFAWSLVALFCVYPARIVPGRVLVGLAALLSAAGIAGLLDPWPDTYGIQTIAMVASVGVTFALVAVQAWKARGDPVHRASVAWVGTALLLSTGLFTAVSFLPQLMGKPPLVGDSLAMSAFLLFYFALAVAIIRYRMFDLGQWTVYVVRAVFALILILLADMTLVYWAGEKWTLSVAVLLVALAWMPARARLLRLADRRRDAGNMQLIRGANQIAFAIRPAEQAALWQDTLAALFDPLEILPATVETAEIRDDGRVLVVPSPLGGEALALGYAGKGSRVFDSNDLDMAKVLHRLVEEMIEARRAYDRGVREERIRIARDLHDDVGARLLTGLHMADQRLRPTLQAAMSDIRAIVSGMTEDQISLERLLGDGRYEAVRRLEAADIALDWQVDEWNEEEHPLDYRQRKALASALREMVSNVIRHAEAKNVTVRIAVNDGALEVVVRDDGKGMPAGVLSGETQGYGLRSLRRRMEDVDGWLDICSGPGGTEIWLSMPLSRAAMPSPSEQGVTRAGDGLT